MSEIIVNNQITYYPNVQVDFVKIDSDISKTMSEAASNKKMTSTTVLLQDFTTLSQQSLDAKYYSSELRTSNKYTFYKKIPNQTYYNYVCTLDNGETTFFDYNVTSNSLYHYIAVVEQKDASETTYYTIYETTDDDGDITYFKTPLTKWTICNIEETDEDNVYAKIGHTWALGFNLGDENITFNTNAVSWDSLGKYPKISYGEKSYDSMQFSGLLGNIEEYTDYEFPDEGNLNNATKETKYQYTEKFERFMPNSGDTPTWGINQQIGSNYYQYSRETEKLAAWKEFINDGALKLLRDVKGNSWIIQVVDNNSYTIDNTSNIKQTTINFTWQEVASTSGVSIIKIGEDFSDE